MIGTIHAVLFDFDGTLTEPGALDFDQLREQIGCPAGKPVLEYLSALPGERRSEVARILDEFELAAARRARVNPGAEALIQRLRDVAVPCAILTRNSRRSISEALSRLPFPRDAFRTILTRDDAVPIKPDPGAVHIVADRLGVETSQLLCVGDFVFDIRAGRAAGAPTVLLTNGSQPPEWASEADAVVSSIDELRALIELHRPLAAGKVPNQLLAPILDAVQGSSDDLLFGPGIGRDAAVVRIGGQDPVAVLKSDPVTFASEDAAHYAVTVNCNDIAVAGGRPAWLLTSLLFPPGTAAYAIQSVFDELASACRRFGVIHCGGHTEITDAVTRPVISAHAVGVAAAGEWIGRNRVREGDEILATKWAGLEGTALLAREFPSSVARCGLSKEEIDACRDFIFDPGIDIVTEARLAGRSPGLTALHDVTEGGIATALQELAEDCNRRFRVAPAEIPVRPETDRICRRLGIDPLGLIGSGCLLIVIRPTDASRLLMTLRKAGIPAERIGRVETGSGLVDGEGHAWRTFAVDEFARFSAESGDAS